MASRNEAQVLFGLQEKRAHLEQLQSKLALLEKLAAQKQAMLLATGVQMTEVAAQEENVETEEDDDENLLVEYYHHYERQEMQREQKQAEQKEQMLMEYLSQLERQQQDVKRMLMLTQRKRELEERNGTPLNAVKSFPFNSQPISATSIPFGSQSRGKGSVEEAPDTRRKLQELRQSVGGYIEDTLSQIYTIEKCSREYGSTENTEPFKERLVNLFKIKDEVDNLIERIDNNDTEPQMSYYTEPSESDRKYQIGASDIEDDEDLDDFEEIKSTTEFEAIIRAAKQRDQQNQMAKLYEFAQESNKENRQEDPKEDGELGDSDLKEAVLDRLLSFLVANENDPYFILNILDRLCKIKPEQRVAILNVLASFTSQQPADKDDRTVFQEHQQQQDPRLLELSQEEDEEPDGMTLDMLRQFQQFTVSLIQERYEIDEKTLEELNNMVEQFIYGYIGLEPETYIDEMMEGLNEILVQLGLKPRETVLNEENSIILDFQADDENTVGGDTIVDEATNNEPAQKKEMATEKAKVEWVEADEQSTPDWISATQNPVVEEEEMVRESEADKIESEKGASMASPKHSMTLDQLLSLKKMVEDELAHDDFDSVINEAAASLQNASLIDSI